MQIKLTIRKTQRCADGRYSVQYSFAHRGKTTYRASGVFVGSVRALKHGQIAGEPNANYNNAKLLQRLIEYQKAYDALPDSYKSKSVYEIVEFIERREKVRSVPFADFAQSAAAGSTMKIYALSKFRRAFPCIAVHEITRAVLDEFAQSLERAGLCKTTIGICLGKLRTLYHAAQNQDLVSRDSDPFYKYKIPKGSRRETALTIDEMKRLRDVELTHKTEQIARDVFMVIFYLGGINMKDLMSLQAAQNGRISYRRAKTADTKDDDVPVSLAVQPELLPYIEKYKGADTLFDFGCRYTNYTDFTGLVNCYTKRAAARAGISANLSTYVARHSWATIADELGVSEGVIDCVLGHSVRGMAMNYIHRRYKAADEAMRKVLDALL